MRVAACLFALLTVTACSGDTDPNQPDENAAPGSLSLDDVQTVATGLEVPWDIAFVDEDTILVTERGGRVRLVENGRVSEDLLLELDVLSVSEEGLLGLALHPDFPEDRHAYIYYTTDADNRVSRYELDEDLRFGTEDVVIDGIPAAQNHDGGRIAFGPDGMLYIGTGDAQDEASAADIDSLAGKILRVSPDGSVPDDNPTRGSPVYSYGHRNVQGLDWDEDGRMFASEHGPTGEGGLCCHDELNVIEEGGFYGWPYRAGESPGPVSGDPPEEPIDPLAESGQDTWAPSGIAVDTSADEDAVLVATLAGRELLRFVVQDDSAEEPSAVLDGHGRLRAARFGPDDCLYLTTSNTDGRGSPSEEDDRILKICP